jgi:hypothetical protein
VPLHVRQTNLSCACLAALQVLGNAKGVVAVVVSLLYFRNPVNFYSVFGYSITVTGVVMYSQVTADACVGAENDTWRIAGEHVNAVLRA